jgi:hypothetical protein
MRSENTSKGVTHHMNESDYLVRQANESKAAMAGTVREIGQTLNRQIVAHPFLTLGIAGLAGAFAARAVRPVAHDGDRQHPPAPPFLDGLFRETIQPIIADLALTALGTVAAVFRDRGHDSRS